LLRYFSSDDFVLCIHTIFKRSARTRSRRLLVKEAASAAAITLPPCELSRLQDLEILLSSSFSSAQLREKVALAIETQGYVGKLCDLFHMCEDLENIEALRIMHQIARDIFVFLGDVCLPAPSLFEENLLSVLNSYLFFNRVDIVSMLQDDKQLLKKLFDQLKDPSTSTERRKDLTMFLKEFCSFSTSLQPNGPQGREVFYKTLMQNDVLATIEPCIMSKDPQTMATTVEMFVMIVEFNPQIARDYLLQQGRNLSDAKNVRISFSYHILFNKIIGLPS
uniref:Serine/threonine-protein phosphatase 4 regulatory subunit 3-like central domain-containing protein n=1 Tax=Parascaris equorum TaxID=6256 RepID=A0A914REF1_PAREQ